MRQLPLPIWLLLTVSLCVTACRATGYYRVVDLPDPPDRALAKVKAELKASGYRVRKRSSHGRQVRLEAVERRPPVPLASSARPPAAPPSKKKPPRQARNKKAGKPDAPPRRATPTPGSARKATTARKSPLALRLTLAPHKTGTRVLVHAKQGELVYPVFLQSPHNNYKPSFGLNGRNLLWEAYAVSGYRHAPGYKDSLAIEAGARIGYRVIHLGGGVDRPEPVVSLGLAAGLGGGWSTGDQSGYAMPSLTMSYLIRRTIEPVPGTVIPIGPEISIDLHAVGLLGNRRAALEGQLVIRYGDIAGLYVGVGHQWLPTRGTTFTAGLYLSTIGAAIVAAIVGLLASI